MDVQSLNELKKHAELFTKDQYLLHLHHSLIIFCFQKPVMNYGSVQVI